MMHYCYNDVKNAFDSLGIKRGDILFSHSNLGFFGIPEGGMNEDNLFNTFYNAIMETIGEEGGLIVPTFTYSFSTQPTKENVFDFAKTPPKMMGMFPSKILTLEGSKRTFDPMFSVAICGNIQAVLPQNIISTECFGEGSICDVMYKKDAKICNFNFDSGSTYLHYVEKKYNVPYREDKVFKGKSVINEKVLEHEILFYCRKEKNKYYANFEAFDSYVKQKNISSCARIGRGKIVLISAKHAFDAFGDCYNKNLYFMTKESA